MATFLVIILIAFNSVFVRFDAIGVTVVVVTMKAASTRLK